MSSGGFSGFDWLFRLFVCFFGGNALVFVYGFWSILGLLSGSLRLVGFPVYCLFSKVALSVYLSCGGGLCFMVEVLGLVLFPFNFLYLWFCFLGGFGAYGFVNFGWLFLSGCCLIGFCLPYGWGFCFKVKVWSRFIPF